MKPQLVAFASGVLFSVGLGISGMVQPTKVIGFLDVAGTWDPTLVFVMASSVGVYFLAHLAARKRGRPLLAGTFEIPGRSGIDLRLVGGSALFGMGWGLGGYCPGPALTSLVSGTPFALAFVASMIVGMLLVDLPGWPAAGKAASRAPGYVDAETPAGRTTAHHS